MDDDMEGKIIQEQGVAAIDYSAKLWDDSAARLAIMREDNLDAAVAKSETELDAFAQAVAEGPPAHAASGTFGAAPAAPAAEDPPAQAVP